MFRKKKPTISQPFPADPDLLEGDKWRYVILTRLDADKPPTRPPRTRRQQRRRTGDSSTRRSRRVSSRRSRHRADHQYGPSDSRPDQSDRPERRLDRTDTAGGYAKRLYVTRLAELTLRAYQPTAIVTRPTLTHSETKRKTAKKSWTATWWWSDDPPNTAKTIARPRVGLFESVRCIGAMTHSLLL